MHWTTLEGIVEILAMRGGAVDEGGTRGSQHTPVADRGAWAVIVPAAKRAFDIILVARGDAQADDIDQQILAFARGCRRKPARLHPTDFFSNRFAHARFCHP